MDRSGDPDERERNETMDSLTTDFWDVLLWSFWFFVWVTALVVWFRCLFDLFGDRSLSGWAKAGWAILLVVVPWLGALIYIIARGRSMAERRQEAAERLMSDQEAYIKQVAGSEQSPAEQIAAAKSLLDSHTITASEFESIKAKALL